MPYVLKKRPVLTVARVNSEGDFCRHRHQPTMGILRLGFFITLVFLSGCREQLIHNLSELQANRLVSRLLERKISPRKMKQGEDRWMVEVDREDLPAAMREVQRLRLVRGNQAGHADSGSMVASRDQQRFAFERALSTEIERTLLSMEGVVDARVHLNLPQVDPLFGKLVAGSQGSGSVFLVSESTPEFDRDLIARLASGASGIPAGHIAVLVEILPSAGPVSAVGTEEQSVDISESRSSLASISEGLRPLMVNRLFLLPLVVGGLLIFIGGLLLMKIIRRKPVSDL